MVRLANDVPRVQIRESHADGTNMAQVRSSINVTVGMALIEKVTLTAFLALGLLSVALGWNHLSVPSVPHNHPNCAVITTC
jgi:hypothetical protein